MKQPQNLGIARASDAAGCTLQSVSLAMTAFGSIILWSSLDKYSSPSYLCDLLPWEDGNTKAVR